MAPTGPSANSFQALILRLQSFWANQGCVILQPYDIEVGAGTFHPATTLRALGPQPWRAAYVQPSRRPTDGRYGENPNRLQHYYQFQVILKPSPAESQQLYLDSLAALGNETGRFLLAASTSVQEALDSYDDRNGVFAYAIREAMSGRAATDSEGHVSALALGEWVTRRVPVLAAEKQHRQDAVFRTAQRDLRSFPMGAVAR